MSSSKNKSNLRLNDINARLLSLEKKIKKEHHENYFIYAYNKEIYKNNKEKNKKSTKQRKLKIYKTGI